MKIRSPFRCFFAFFIEKKKKTRPFLQKGQAVSWFLYNFICIIFTFNAYTGGVF